MTIDEVRAQPERQWNGLPDEYRWQAHHWSQARYPVLYIILFLRRGMCEFTADRFHGWGASALLTRTALRHGAPRSAAVIAHRADHPCQHRNCGREEQEARDQDRKPFALADGNEAQHQVASLLRVQSGGGGFLHYPWQAIRQRNPRPGHRPRSHGIGPVQV